MSEWRILHGDLFDRLKELPSDYVHACVTDPPYGIGFMGREWDTFKPGTAEARIVPNRQIDSDNPNLKGRTRGPASSPSAVEYDYTVAGLRGFQDWTARWAAEVYRVLKPGAYLVVCGAPRSHHRMMCGLEDAGFVVRDCFAWLFASGFPKSHNFGCKCGGNSVSYSHERPEPPAERDVRLVLDPDLPSAVDNGYEPREVLLEGLPEQGLPAHGEANGPGVDDGREQPLMEGRELHRAGQGLSAGQDAEPSESEDERLRAGAHRRGGDDPGAPVEAERGSAPRRSGPSEQQPGKSASLRLPSRTLDDGASIRGSRCARCGGLTAARGLGTALKPAHEPIALAWKPFKGTIAACHETHGTAALNIDACRLGAGRWPANVLLDEEAAALLDAQSGDLMSGANPTRRGSDKFRDTYGEFKGQTDCTPARGLDVGGASRFYYVAKPSRAERDAGCDAIHDKPRDESRKPGNPGGDNPRNRGLQRRANSHPTVKPVDLMRWLVRLVSPEGGLVLDPFTGSGTTGMACVEARRHFIGCEKEADYVEIARARIRSVAPMFSTEVS